MQSLLSSLSFAPLFAGANARVVCVVAKGQTFDPTVSTLNINSEIATMNAKVATVYTPAQADMLTAVGRTVDAFTTSALANAVALAVSEVTLPGMVTSNGREMADHRRSVYNALSARVSESGVKAQFARGFFLFDKFGDDCREAAAVTSPAGAIAEMVKRLAARGIVDQLTLDIARGKVKPKAEKVELTAVQKLKEKLAKAEDAERDAKAKADAEALHASPEGRASRILAMIEEGGFSEEQFATMSAALVKAKAKMVAAEPAVGMAKAA